MLPLEEWIFMCMVVCRSRASLEAFAIKHQWGHV
jgi:hypothetical protein